MTNAQEEDSALRQEYADRRYLYETFCREAVRQLDEVIERERIALAFPIEHRVKSLESILEKSVTRPKKFKSLADMRDVAGLRVILLFRRDVDRVVQLIQQHFQVTHVEDAQSRLEADRFGYASIHFEVHPKSEWLSVPSWKPLAGLTAEIQVRTASQHIWATSSHLLQYKREAHVPVPIRRAINRVAALLELVDLELERVIGERQGYQSAVSQAPPQDNRLDVDVLRQALERYLPADNRDERDELALGDLLDECAAFGVKTESALEALLQKNSEAMKKADLAALRRIKLEGEKSGFRYDPDRVSRGVYYTHVGLARQALKQEFGQDYETYLAGKFAQGQRETD